MSDAFRVISRALHYTSKVSASIRQHLLFYPLVHLDEETQEKYNQTNTIPSNSELVNRLKELNLNYIVYIFAVYKGRYFAEGGRIRRHADEFDPFCFMTQKRANSSALFVFKSRVEFVGNLFVFDVITPISWKSFA